MLAADDTVSQHASELRYLTILEGMVSGLQRPALLRIHGRSLFGGNRKEGGVEDSRVLADSVYSSGRKLLSE